MLDSVGMEALRLYVDVAGYRSFSQAAVKHGITQSAASQRVHQLEKRLGVTLIDRSVRPLALTPAGEEFLRGCRTLVQGYDQLELRIGHLGGPSAGTVRVDAIYSAGIDLLNQVKEQFEARNPHVTVVVDYKRPEQVYEAVRQQRCDLGILSYPRRWREVGVIPLRHEGMALVCAPGHALAGRAVVQARELGAYPLIGFEPSLPAGRHIHRYLRQHGAAPQISNVFDNIDTIKSAVAVTGQAAILPRRTVAREAAAGTLVVVELEPGLERPMGIIYNKVHPSGAGAFSPAAQSFVDFLTRHIGPDGAMIRQQEEKAAPRRAARQAQLVGDKP